MTDPLNLLLFGATGQVGNALIRRVPSDVRLHAVDRLQADLNDGSQTADLIRRFAAAGQVDAVINAAAYTAVDRAESDEAQAQRVNGAAPGVMAAVCAEFDLPLLHISTDYVFDGSQTHPYCEDDSVNPVSAYGRSKLAGEQAVQAAGGRHVILRTSWVFSDHGSNFVKTMLRLAASRPELRVVDDQHGGPTAAADIADALLSLARALVARTGPTGLYHFSGSPFVSWFEFARHILSRQQQLTGQPQPALTRITTAEFPTAAKRPHNSALDCSRIRRDYGIDSPDWQSALDTVMHSLLSKVG
jgi:dTDP-4-dehydrorhamnose reductase